MNSPFVHVVQEHVVVGVSGIRWLHVQIVFFIGENNVVFATMMGKLFARVVLLKTSKKQLET